MRKIFFSFYPFVAVTALFIVFIGNQVENLIFRGLIRKTELKLIVYEAKGAFYVVEQDLLRLPAQRWTERIEILKPKFGYGIDIVAYADLHLDETQKEALRKGKIISDDDLEYLYHQIGGSQMVLRKGPRSELTSEYDESLNDPRLILFDWTLLLLFMTLPCTLWGVLFWRKLRKISMSATAFGNGDFSVRTNVGKRSALTPIVTAFNAMADRIQQLINSHKELTNAVSHELRSPIARIRFGLEMQSTAFTPEKRLRYTQGLRSDVNILEELVAELLTFAGFDRDKPDLCFAYHETTAWLRQLLADILPAGSRVTFRARFPEDETSSSAWFEPKYLGRAVGNLVQNALRHADQQVHLTFEQGGETCFIHVDDDGPGIALEDRKRVFKPFTRLDASRSRASGGYGLGLAIVHRIMTWHGGSVVVSDSPPGGARLTLQWPRRANQ